MMQQEDGSFGRLTSCLPKNLLWSWTLKPFLDALSPGMYAFCTLGHIFDPGTYHLVLWIAAGNARKVEKRLELVLPGEWTVDEACMLSEGVRIRVL